MITTTQVPTQPCQFVAVKKVDGLVFADTYAITEREINDCESEIVLTILDGDSWHFIASKQGSNVDGCALGYWEEGTVFILDI